MLRERTGRSLKEGTQRKDGEPFGNRFGEVECKKTGYIIYSIGASRTDHDESSTNTVILNKDTQQLHQDAVARSGPQTARLDEAVLVQLWAKFTLHNYNYYVLLYFTILQRTGICPRVFGDHRAVTGIKERSKQPFTLTLTSLPSFRRTGDARGGQTSSSPGYWKLLAESNSAGRRDRNWPQEPDIKKTVALHGQGIGATAEFCKVF